MNMNKVYLRKLLIIAVPIMLGNVISQLQMIIDRIFLGQMNTLYMSALGNVTTPMWTTMSFCFSIIAGASILISQNVGAGNDENIITYAAALIKWNNVIPVILFAFWILFSEPVFRLMGVSDSVMPYCLGYAKYYAPVFLLVGVEGSFSVIMQTSNYTKPLVYYGLIRSGVNVVLDWILIFGKLGFPQLGIEGAAIATTIAEFAGCIFAGVMFYKLTLKTKPPYKSIMTAKFKPYYESLKLGINVAFEDFAWNAGNLVLIRILNSINEVAAGIYSIVFSVEVLVVVIIGAVGNATMTLSGEAKGMGDARMYKKVCQIAYAMSAGVSFVTMIVCIIFPQNILSLFSKDPMIITGCGIYLIMVCLNLYGKSANIIIGSGIRGSGDTKWMFYTQLFGTCLIVGVAAIFVYVLDMGITGVFLAVMVDEAIRAIVNLLKINRIIKAWEAN